MKSDHIFTKIFILCVFLLVVVVDICLALNGKPGDTISEVTANTVFVNRIIFIPWAIGFLCGHLFTWKDKKPLPFWLSMVTGVGIGAVLNLLHILIFPAVYPLVYVTVGAFAGSFLWYQRKREANNG